MSEYEAALTNYRPVRYSHIKIKPGADYVLTADPWSHLHSFLLNDLEHRRGKKKADRKRAIFYLDLAQNFYRASDAAELPAKATLLYYGMLNLVKVWMSTNGTELETSIEHHGLTMPLGKGRRIEALGKSSDSLSIFAEFAEALGTPCDRKKTLSLEEAITHVPELHSVQKSQRPEQKQKFLAVEIKFLTDQDHKLLLTRISYEKKAEGLVKAGKIYGGQRREYFKEPLNENGNVCLYSKMQRRPTNWKNIARAYNSFLGEFEIFDISSLLTRGGYQYYLDLEPGDFHHLCYTLIVMYYLGTAARYRPTEMSRILNGKLGSGPIKWVFLGLSL